MSKTNVVPINQNLPAQFAGIDMGDFSSDLSGGITGGFAVVSIRGSKWRVKHGGEETLLTNDDGDPIAGLEVVIVKANNNLSHIFYEGAYEEGSKEAPDCFSLDGIKPDPSSPKPQCKTCAACPQQVWGSKTSPAGKPITACNDARRIAVVPEGDIANEVYGGPMLLRVPAASLNDLKLFESRVIAKGKQYMTVATRLTFDPDASYPKLVFRAMRPLSDPQLDQLVEHYKGDMLERMLTEAPEFEPTETEPAEAAQSGVPVSDDDAFDGLDDDTAAAEAEAAAAAKKVAAAKKRKEVAAAKKAAAAAKEAADNEFDDELDAPELVKAESKKAPADNTSAKDDDLDDLMADMDAE